LQTFVERTDSTFHGFGHLTRFRFGINSWNYEYVLHSGRTPWTEDRPTASSLPIQNSIHTHTHTNAVVHPWFDGDSIPRSTCSSDQRPYAPYTALPFGTDWLWY